MNWIINKSTPICTQICEQICVFISKGEYKANEKIPSVRELALLIGVTPNTVQKAYENLQEKKVIYSVKASGWYVGEDTKVASEIVDNLKVTKTNDYLNQMEKIGYSPEKTLIYLKERIGE